MDTGLLWYDDDSKRPLPLKIAEAVARYRERLSHEPTVCYVNPRQVAEAAPPPPPAKRGKGSSGRTVNGRGKPGEPPSVRVVGDERLRPNYLLLTEEAPDDAQLSAPAADGGVPALTPPPAALDATAPDSVTAPPAAKRGRRAATSALVAPLAHAPAPATVPLANNEPEPRHRRMARSTAPALASTPAEEQRPRQSARRANGAGKRVRPVPAPPVTPAAKPAAKPARHALVPPPAVTTRPRRPSAEPVSSPNARAHRVSASKAPVAPPAQRPPAATAPERAVRRARGKKPALAQQPATVKPSVPATPPAPIAQARRSRTRKAPSLAIAQPSLFALPEPAPATRGRRKAG
jgi:hypothetical protein